MIKLITQKDQVIFLAFPRGTFYVVINSENFSDYQYYQKICLKTGAVRAVVSEDHVGGKRVISPALDSP